LKYNECRQKPVKSPVLSYLAYILIPAIMGVGFMGMAAYWASERNGYATIICSACGIILMLTAVIRIEARAILKAIEKQNKMKESTSLKAIEPHTDRLDQRTV
jgi:hypothetical protein